MSFHEVTGGVLLLAALVVVGYVILDSRKHTSTGQQQSSHVLVYIRREHGDTLLFAVLLLGCAGLMFAPTLEVRFAVFVLLLVLAGIIDYVVEYE